MADHVVGLMSASQKGDSTALDPFRNALARRCTADHWSDGPTSCLRAAEKLEVVDSCERQLTADQAAALEADLRTALENLQPKQ